MPASMAVARSLCIDFGSTGAVAAHPACKRATLPEPRGGEGRIALHGERA